MKMLNGVDILFMAQNFRKWLGRGLELYSNSFLTYSIKVSFVHKLYVKFTTIVIMHSLADL